MTSEERFMEMMKGNLSKESFPAVIQAKVKSAGTTSCVVTLTENNLELPDVQYSATDENELGVILVPKVGTNALVGLIGQDINSLYLINADEIEKVNLVVGATKMVIDTNGIVINDGTNGGMCITPTLVQELNKNNQILQGIISVLSGAPITEPGNGSPSALQTTLKAAIAGKVLGNFTSIEDTKVTH